MNTETLDLQTSTVKEVLQYGDHVYCFSTGGLDVYSISPGGWKKIAWASLFGVIDGAVNENGVYLATSASGVYMLDNVILGDNTNRLFKQYATNDAPVEIASNNIQSIDAKNENLLICTDIGAHYFPTQSVGYEYDAGKAFVTPADSAVTTGTISSGTFANLDLRDGTYLAVQEVGGVPGFQIDMQFSVVGSAVSRLNIYGYYAGTSTHTINVQAYNYNTTSWDTLGTYAEGTSDSLKTYSLVDANHRSNDVVQIRLYHANAGDVSHIIYLDEVWLTMTNEGCKYAAVSDTQIAYGVESGGVHVLDFPSADWNEQDVTVLTTITTPNLSSDTTQALAFGADLFIGNDAGVDIYDGSTVTQILPPTKAIMSAASLVTGTTTSGTFLSTHMQDGVYYQVTEQASSPALTLNMTFNGGIVTTVNSLKIYGRYDGGASPHTVNVQAWNYNTTSWDTLGTLPNSGTDALHTFTLTDADHRSGGTVLCRIYQSGTGNIGHSVYLDYVYLDIDAGLVVDVKDLYPSSDAATDVGEIAICTSDGLGGGRYVVRDLPTATNLRAVSGDTNVCWFCERLCYGIYDTTLEYFTNFTVHAPRDGARDVRRDWTIYGELTESIGIIDDTTITLKINGQTVTHTATPITNGYIITYSTPSPSNYSTPVRASITADILLTGETFSFEWGWFTETAPELTVSTTKPPNVVCYRDISLSSTEREDVYNSINVIWQPEIRSSLLVSETQAQAVGTKAIDELTYHRHLRTIQIKDADDSLNATNEIKEGDIITITATSIGDSSKKVQVLAKQRVVNKDSVDNRVEYRLLVAHYEAV